jgi:heat shock protein HslJ
MGTPSATACVASAADHESMIAVRIALCVLLASAGAALGADPPSVIEGPTWQLMTLQGQDLAPRSSAERPVSIRFVAGRVDGFSGCNRLMGSYKIDRDRITLGPLAGTMMACAPPAMALEDEVKRALSGTFRYAITDDRLTLSRASGPKLVFQREATPTLDGVKWDVTGYNNGRHAVVSPVAGTQLTLAFDAGMVTGHGGCNSFRAAYTRDGERITIQPPAMTRMACNGEGVMAQEQEFLTALATATTWTISNGMLDLHRADGERVLTANPHAD